MYMWVRDIHYTKRDGILKRTMAVTSPVVKSYLKKKICIYGTENVYMGQRMYIWYRDTHYTKRDGILPRIMTVTSPVVKSYL